MKIPITQGKFVLIDDQDYEIVSKYKWYFDLGKYASANSPMVHGKRGRTIRMHRLVMNAPEGMEIDHINGDGLDNRKSNLRCCTHAENIHNAKMRKDNTSGYFGVKRNGKNWCAVIHINMKKINLGTYKTKEEAAVAYNEAAYKYHGDFAKLNIFV